MRPCPLRNFPGARQSGNVLFLILIAVMLFGGLSYVVTQSGRGGGNVNKEQARLDTALAEQCVAHVEHGMNKLQLFHGCAANEISYELPDGTNENPANPGNTACFLFDPAGAGLTACGIYLTAGGCADSVLEALAIGEIGCGTIVYAGISGGNRIYTTLADTSAGIVWNNNTTNWVVTGVTSSSNGLANTNTLVGLSDIGAPYQAALACRGIGSDWYLPAMDELNLFYTNRAVGALNGTFDTSGGGAAASRYWSSAESDDTNAWTLRFSNGGQAVISKRNARLLRCARR